MVWINLQSIGDYVLTIKHKGLYPHMIQTIGVKVKFSLSSIYFHLLRKRSCVPNSR